MLKVNSKDTRMTSSVFIVNFEHNLHLFLVFLLLNLNRKIFAGLRNQYFSEVVW